VEKKRANAVKPLLIACLLSLPFAALLAEAAAGEADELAAKAVFFSTRPSMRVEASLSVVMGKESKKRELELLFSSKKGSSRLLARVVSPAFLREMKVLQVSSEKGDDTWIKTSQGVKRIGRGSKPEALFQSDFLTSDFSLPAGGWRASVMDGNDGMRVIERDGLKGEGFAFQRLSLRGEGLLVSKREFLDVDGKTLRAYEVLEWKAEDGLERPVRIELRTRKEENHSLLEVTKLDGKADLPDGLFSPGAL
jgi:hypothetical protein